MSYQEVVDQYRRRCSGGRAAAARSPRWRNTKSRTAPVGLVLARLLALIGLGGCAGPRHAVALRTTSTPRLAPAADRALAAKNAHPHRRGGAANCDLGKGERHRRRRQRPPTRFCLILTTSFASTSAPLGRPAHCPTSARATCLRLASPACSAGSSPRPASLRCSRRRSSSFGKASRRGAPQAEAAPEGLRRRGALLLFIGVLGF